MGAKYWLLFGVFMVLITFQAIHYIEFQDKTSRFVSQGPRFTAQDGQTLCERIAKLEIDPQPCAFVPHQPPTGH